MGGCDHQPCRAGTRSIIPGFGRALERGRLSPDSRRMGAYLRELRRPGWPTPSRVKPRRRALTPEARRARSNTFGCDTRVSLKLCCSSQMAVTTPAVLPAVPYRGVRPWQRGGAEPSGQCTLILRGGGGGVSQGRDCQHEGGWGPGVRGTANPALGPGNHQRAQGGPGVAQADPPVGNAQHRRRGFTQRDFCQAIVDGPQGPLNDPGVRSA
jgi:hypothetical protein